MSDNIAVNVQRDPSSSAAGLNRAGSTEEQIVQSKPDENAVMSEGMSHFEAGISFIFGVVLPTVDVGSDLWMAFKLIPKPPQCSPQSLALDYYHLTWALSHLYAHHCHSYLSPITGGIWRNPRTGSKLCHSSWLRFGHSTACSS